MAALLALVLGLAPAAGQTLTPANLRTAASERPWSYRELEELRKRLLAAFYARPRTLAERAEFHRWLADWELKWRSPGGGPAPQAPAPPPAPPGR